MHRYDSLRRFHPRHLWTVGLVASTLALGVLACQDDQERLASFMAKADQYREAEQYEEAIIEYRNVLQIDPNYADAHRHLSKMYFKTEQVREGYWELSETVRLDPTDVDSRVQFAAITLASEQFDEAIEAADAVLEIDPENARGHLYRGQALLLLERPGEAQAAMERAIEIDPDASSSRMALASLLQGIGESEQAEMQLQESLSRDPVPLAHTMMAILLTGRGAEDAEIEGHLVKALELASKPSEDGEQNRELVSAYRNLAAFMFDRDRADEAVVLLEGGVEKLQDDRLELNETLVQYFRSVGDTERADLALQRATEFDSTDAGPWLVISDAKGNSGDAEGALAAAEKAIEADPESAVARLRKAELLIDLGSSGEDEELHRQGRAIATAELEANPSSPEASFVMGKVELADRNFDESIRHLRVALDGQPNWPQAHFVLGSVLLLNKEKQRARASLARAVELYPDFDEARRILIRLHSQLGEHEYAIENGRRYLNRRSDDYKTMIVMAQSMVRLGMIDEAQEILEGIPEEERNVDAFFALGRLAMVKSNAEDAEAALLKADEISPNDPRVLHSLLIVYSSEGDTSEMKGRMATALEANPESSPLWHVEGLRLMNVGEMDSAEEAFLKSLEHDPSAVDNYAQLARIYAASGELQRAVQQYERAVQARPDNGNLRHFLGVLYEMTGNPEKAKVKYEEALEQDSNLAETKNNLAYMMAEQGGDLDRALKLAQEAKAALPDSASAADTLGWVLYKRGVSSAAIGYLREAISITEPNDPNLGEIRLHLATAYESAGDVDKAIETLETALSQLQQLKESGKLARDPAWASGVRGQIERLKAAG